ncbi:hypothetical protein BH11MYX3_BH11MYX3_14450 [soil metagenome]
MNRAWALGALLAGCTSFEDPDIVVDLRVLALSADHPEQVVDVDLANPQMPVQLLQQIVPAQVCALVADPAFERRIRWSLTLCSYGDYSRCSPDAAVTIASGIADDPETAATPPQICGTVTPNANLLGVLLDTLEGDQLRGLGGVDYLVQLTVGGEDADPELDLYAAKDLRVAPRIPTARQANQNPNLDRIEATIDHGDPIALGTGRCVEGAPTLTIQPRDLVRLTPIEPVDAREPYVVPTLDGTGRMFTESLTYQWIASAGGFSSGSTGGPRDITGNPPPLFSDWRAPNAEDLAGPTDIELWIIQRDERLGVTWYQSCIRVVP